MIKQIVEQWHEENFTMIDEVAQSALIAKLGRVLIPRAEVAAALDALRRGVHGELLGDGGCEYNEAIGDALFHVDKAITKLGLAPGEKQ